MNTRPLVFFVNLELFRIVDFFNRICDNTKNNVRGVSMTQIEKAAFLRLFNRDGYVLNFSTNDFDIFTAESVGVPLCQQYKKSKGASLTTFCATANDDLVVKLLGDLLDYYELQYKDSAYESDENKTLYQKCKIIIDRERGHAVKIETPSISGVNREYIVDISGRALRDVDNGDYDSAVTKARTLLEEVFYYVIEKAGERPVESGEINRLYGQVKQLYNMHQDKDVDKRINGLLSGLEKILSAIADMRNKGSDAHGVGAKRINISDHHARLFVNSAMTMADFILSVAEKKNFGK